MDVKRSGSQPSAKGSAEWFTGAVRIDPLFDAPSHALGQTLVVTAGCGRVQRWGGTIKEIRPGDVVWIVPGEKHWHGAAPTTAMTHIAIVEKTDENSTAWTEQVSDEQYQD